jgi:hypothetical protein
MTFKFRRTIYIRKSSADTRNTNSFSKKIYLAAMMVFYLVAGCAKTPDSGLGQADTKRDLQQTAQDPAQSTPAWVLHMSLNLSSG